MQDDAEEREGEGFDYECGIVGANEMTKAMVFVYERDEYDMIEDWTNRDDDSSLLPIDY
jgi:hypothetical protein